MPNENTISEARAAELSNDLAYIDDLRKNPMWAEIEKHIVDKLKAHEDQLLNMNLDSQRRGEHSHAVIALRGLKNFLAERERKAVEAIRRWNEKTDVPK